MTEDEARIQDLEKALVQAALIVHTLTSGIMPTEEERAEIKAQAAEWTTLVQGEAL